MNRTPMMPAATANDLSLVADIGGTNTRVALARGQTVEPGSIERFRNADHAGLEQVLAAYLAARGMASVIGTCVAVAGPVRGNAARLTNRDWSMTTASIGAATGTRRVIILNDLQAQGHAVGRIADDKLRAVLPGRASAPGATRLVIGIGTGFNAAPVHSRPGGRLGPPAEAGHVSLPVRTADDLRLAGFLEQAHGFASVEDALSGRGIENLYAWHSAEQGDGARRASVDIIGAAGDGSDPLAVATVRTAVRLFGAVAGNLALEILPFGGIWLIGGIARALEPWFGQHGFAETFREKGRFSDFMDAFPVAVIEDDYAALTGCAAHLAETFPG